MYEQILYDVDDPVATITLNRPDALNAWTGTMAAEVKDAVHRAERDRRVVGIVLTGAGRGFCAGADMNTLSDLSSGGRSARDQPARRGAERSSDLARDAGDPSWGEDLRGEYTYLLSVPKPIIAAINGPIAGMAVPIAMACDLRFMAPDAVLTVAFSQRGLVAEWGSGWLLPKLVGTATALDLLFSSRKVDGNEAMALGLVNRVVPKDELLQAATDYIGHLAERCSPASLAVMKRQVYEHIHAGLADAERQARQFMTESFDRPDFKEGVESFLEKRPPRFDRIGD